MKSEEGRWFIEEPNLVSPKPQTAYDVSDAVSRIEKLALTDNERLRVVRLDERVMLVGHLAEAVWLRIFPYELVVHEGKLGSVVQIKGDDGQTINVFRKNEDMLSARVHKCPDDKRSWEAYEAFMLVIQPQVNQLSDGERLVYFSPPNTEGEYESKYGFMFEYRMCDGVLSCLSYMLDLELDEYEMVYQSWEKNRIDNGQSTPVLKFGNNVFNNQGEILANVLGSVWENRNDSSFWGESVTDWQDWVKQQKELYGEIEKYVASSVLAENFYEAIARGDRERANQLIEPMRMALLKKYQPEVYDYIQNQIRMIGWVMIDLGCGPMMFGGGSFMDGLNLAIMGIVDPELYIYRCKCGYENPIDVPNKKYCKVCARCGAPVEKCV